MIKKGILLFLPLVASCSALGRPTVFNINPQDSSHQESDKDKSSSGNANKDSLPQEEHTAAYKEACRLLGKDKLILSNLCNDFNESDLFKELLGKYNPDTSNPPCSKCQFINNLVDYFYFFAKESVKASAEASGLYINPHVLFWAIEKNYIDLVEPLVRHVGIDTIMRYARFEERKKDFGGREPQRSALHLAVELDKSEIVEQLLCLGANPDIRVQGKPILGPPLHIAIMHGKLKLVELLLYYGADVHQKSGICVVCNKLGALDAKGWARRYAPKNVQTQLDNMLTKAESRSKKK